MSKIKLAREVLSHNPNCNKLLLCNILHIARSLLYYQSKMEIKDTLLQSELQSLHTVHPWYGHRRLAWSMGICFEKARRLMKKFSIVAKVRIRKKFIKTADVGLPDTKIPNLTKNICPIRANVIWRTDFTHIIYHGIHLYLATVLDAYTREILGYSISFVHTKEFALEAIKMAIKYTQAIPQIFHSDQGSEYRSFLIMSYLREQGIQISMSKKGSPWENGGQESYYGKFKLELDSPNAYACIEDLIAAIHYRIYYYNHERIHTALKMPPKKFASTIREREEIIKKRCILEVCVIHSNPTPQESLFVFAQETGELTSIPVTPRTF